MCYFFLVVRGLKRVPLVSGLSGTFLAGLALVFWPFLDGAWRARKPRSEAAMVVGSVSFLLVLGLLVWEALS